MIKKLSLVSDQMVNMYDRWCDVLLWLDFLWPGLQVNEIYATCTYDRLHKESLSLNPRINARSNKETGNNCV